MKEMAPWKYFPFRDAFFKNHSEKFPWEMTIRVTFDLVVDHFVKQLRNHQKPALMLNGGVGQKSG